MTVSPGRTALVLGGGGAVGNAWLIGLLAGLLEGGLDVTDADLVIGTSAGATAAAQTAAVSPSALYADILAAGDPAPRAAPTAPGAPGRRGPGTDHLERLRATIAASAGADDYRRRICALLAASDAGPSAERWRATVGARLPNPDWPARRMLLTAVDVDTAEPVLLDRDSGIDLVDAVAASCAGGFAYAAGGRRFVDGGYRANADNAGLAAGHARVLVLSPLGGRALTPAEWGTHLDTEVEGLREGGSEVETVFPDAAARAAFGENLLDPSTRLPVARAAHAHGIALAPRLVPFWRG
jgi:NTE family protein